MTDAMRERIIETARNTFENTYAQYDFRKAVVLTAFFRDGMIYGSQDAKIINAINALWDEFRLNELAKLVT